jgi:hypothetical protein
LYLYPKGTCYLLSISISRASASKCPTSAAADNFEAITAITKNNDSNTILSWTDKEEEKRDKNIPESSWFEEKTIPSVEYIDYTNL